MGGAFVGESEHKSDKFYSKYYGHWGAGGRGSDTDLSCGRCHHPILCSLRDFLLRNGVRGVKGRSDTGGTLPPLRQGAATAPVFATLSMATFRLVRIPLNNAPCSILNVNDQM